VTGFFVQQKLRQTRYSKHLNDHVPGQHFVDVDVDYSKSNENYWLLKLTAYLIQMLFVVSRGIKVDKW
jgi:hypothetical protein